jgi:hypothetical protein
MIARWDKRDSGGGRFRASPKCDGCGKPTGRDCATDDEVCQGGDGPGFYLCGRVRCGKRYVGMAVDARRAFFTAQRDVNESKTLNQEEFQKC